MAIKVDVSALEQSVLIFKKLREQLTVPVESVGIYLKSPGMLFLKKHLLYYSGVEFDEPLLTQLFEEVTRDPVAGDDENIFSRSMRHGFQYVDVMEKSLNDIDLGAIIQQAFTLANAYLPKKIQEEVTVYILYGIRGTGIMLGNEIAIDICDEYVSIDGFLDINNLIAILAHEFHHIGVHENISNSLQHVGKEKNKSLIRFIEELLSEGVAYYFLPSPYHGGGTLDRKWNNNLGNISVILSKVSHCIGQISNGAPADPTLTQQLFDEGLEGYTAGYVMIKAIHDVFGRTAVFDCIENCLLFPQIYNMAVEKGNLALPIMNYNMR